MIKYQYIIKALCRLLGYFFFFLMTLKPGHDRPVTLTKSGVVLKEWTWSSIYLSHFYVNQCKEMKALYTLLVEKQGRS